MTPDQAGRDFHGSTYENLTPDSDFAQAQSWTINKHNTTQLYLSNTDGYWALEFKNNFLFTIACTGFDNSRDAFNQPGSSSNAQSAYREIKTATTHLENGNFVSYDFFGTNQYLHVVVQIEAERFRHFGIGECTMNGIAPRQVLTILGERWMIR